MSEPQTGLRCSPVGPDARPGDCRLAERERGTEVNTMTPYRKAAKDYTSPGPALLPTWCKAATRAWF